MKSTFFQEKKTTKQPKKYISVDKLHTFKSKCADNKFAKHNALKQIYFIHKK